MLATLAVAATALVAPTATVSTAGRPARGRAPGPRAASTAGSQAAVQALMQRHDPILLYVSRVLSDDMAQDAGALYAWCRRLDQIVDEPESSDPATTRLALDDWAARLDRLCDGDPADEMDAALTETLERHPTLSRGLFADMIAGMRSDVEERRRIKDYAELELYAYQVAGTVGLMLLPLLGLSSEAQAAPARAPAVALGQAVQLINILRDARPDAAMGRIYLPADEMAALGVSEDDVLGRRATPEYRQLVARTAARAEALLLEAERGAPTLPGLGPLLAQTIVELYRDYLVELARRGHDNLSDGGERVKVGTARKLGSTLRAAVRLLRGPPP